MKIPYLKKNKRDRQNSLKTAGVALAVLSVILSLALSAFAVPPAPVLLDPKTISKYVNQLTGPPPVYEPTVVKKGKMMWHEYTVDMTEFYQQILPIGFPMTKTWGYAGMAKDPITGESLGYVQSSPGATFEAIRGILMQVTWRNKITSPHMFAIDPTLHWANPNNMEMPMYPFEPYPPGYPEAQHPVPLVTHLHGGEVQSTSDGHPDAWWTWDGKQGVVYNTVKKTKRGSAIFYYPNTQLPTTLWYHDHALGITRLNVGSGLAGFYLLRDPDDPIAPLLPSGMYEMPIVIQDRNFYADGSFYFPSDGANPDIHPYWEPEFFGNTIMVNGKVWPNMNVEPRQYRFRLLDGSNARFYKLFFVEQTSMTNVSFIQIGSDGGYLPWPVTLTEVTLAPAERADILIDFSDFAPGTKIILRNNAKAPFPKGEAADPQTVGQIMQFTVMSRTPVPPTPLPTPWPITVSMLTPDAPSRTLTLIEVMAALGPEMVLLDGQKWGAPISEWPQVGSTEDWYLVNPTEDAHPIHLHLVQFQAVSRQGFNVEKYLTDWMAVNGMPPFDHPTVQISLDHYLIGQPKPPETNEIGWKDTVIAYPGEVTVIRVRFAPQDAVGAAPGINLYPFDPTYGPGYVWHCHILEHEDNEMMRPYKVIS